MNEDEFEIYKINSGDLGPWLDELLANRRLLDLVSRRKRGPIMEVKFIFREGGNKEKKSYKNVEQWTSVPYKSKDKEV